MLVDARVAWGFLCAAAFTGWAISTRDELTLKLVGVALQLAGVFVATFAVLAVGRLFEVPSARQSISAWWKRRPLATQHLTAGTLIGGGSFLGAHVSHQPAAIDPQECLALQVAKLASNQSELFALAAAMRERVDLVDKTLTATIQREEQERAAQANKISKTVQQATAGSPMVAVLGLFCIALGLVLGTVPQELACFCLRVT